MAGLNVLMFRVLAHPSNNLTFRWIFSKGEERVDIEQVFMMVMIEMMIMIMMVIMMVMMTIEMVMMI